MISLTQGDRPARPIGRAGTCQGDDHHGGCRPQRTADLSYRGGHCVAVCGQSWGQGIDAFGKGGHHDQGDACHPHGIAGCDLDKPGIGAEPGHGQGSDGQDRVAQQGYAPDAYALIESA